MKKLECIIRRNKVEDVRNAMYEIGVLGMTVTDVRGVGRQKGRTDNAEASDSIGLLPKVKMELVCLKKWSARPLRRSLNAAELADFGDGKIFISPVEEVIRIRTGETGESAV